MRTHDVVLRLRENPRVVAFVNVRERCAQCDTHLFRRARERRIVAHDVIVQRFEGDRRDFDDIRFRVALRHFVFRFRVRRCVIASTHKQYDANS